MTADPSFSSISILSSIYIAVNISVRVSVSFRLLGSRRPDNQSHGVCSCLFPAPLVEASYVPISPHSSGYDTCTLEPSLNRNRR